MISLPEKLESFMQGQDLSRLKPYALLYRNKWIEESGSGEEGHFELEDTPIDITDMIVKPNTLSMTLDVNEVAQYNCNNITLTLSDTKNKLVEGIPNSLFPEGYQLYGSKVVLFYGIDNPAKNYIIEDGKLISANPNLYLQNNNTWNAYIKTGTIPSKNMRLLAIGQLVDTANSWDGALLGSRVGSGNQEFILWHNTQNVGWGAFVYGSAWGHNWNEMNIKGTKNTFMYDGTSFTINGIVPTNGVFINKNTITNGKEIFLFGFNQNGAYQARSFRGRIYSVKFWDGDKLVRHFVPVPAGLQIGSFIVPSNGMFDIVTQTFFGNSGTGEFIYGFDDSNSIAQYAISGNAKISEEGVLSNCSLTNFVQVNTPFAPGNNTWVQQYCFKTFYPGSSTYFALTNGLLSDFVFPKLTITASSSTTIKVQMCISFNGTGWAYAATSGNIAFDYSKKAWLKLVFDGSSYVLYLKQEGGEFAEVRRYNSSSSIAQPANNRGFSIGADISSGASWVSYSRGEFYLPECFVEIAGEKWFDGSVFVKKEEEAERTAIFTGRIKELPIYKPDTYQVDLKLVSPLEMLKDIEAKEFSNKVVGEALVYDSVDSDNHKVYHTVGTGVGGIDAVYANGTKLFEGVDYEVSQTNALGLSAFVTIINSSYNNDTITADYYTWKTDLSVKQIIEGLVGLAGYSSATEDIRDVVWNTAVRTQETPTNLFTLGFTKNGGLYTYSGEGSYAYGANLQPMGAMYIFDIDWNNPKTIKGTNIFPSHFSYEFKVAVTDGGSWAGQTMYRIGGATKYFIFSCSYRQTIKCVYVDGDPLNNAYYFDIFTDTSGIIKMEKNGNTYTFSGFSPLVPDVQETITADIDWDIQDNVMMYNCNYSYANPVLLYQKLTDLDSGVSLENYGIALTSVHPDTTTWLDVDAIKSDDTVSTSVRYRTSDDGVSYSQWGVTDIGSSLGVSSKIIQFTIELNDYSTSTNFTNTSIYYLGQGLNITLVNLSGKTVLEALQDFALISGYEFGVDRNGVFFFRPRLASTTPTYQLGHSELVKVDTVKKNLNDFFTKLTLTFAQVPLEFYANTGDKPTPIDRYGVINKEIDKPDIVNYDNPELAQAIGPQLLQIYSSLPNIIQATGKLNLSLELGDIVNLKRNETLVEPNSASDYKKYRKQQTYYRACKITGMNYNFSKKQITYTLRDVSNESNSPIGNAEMWEFVYDFPIELGAK